MINGKRVAVVLPAYNAARTLERCVAAIPRESIDDVIIVDDASSDDTVTVASRLGLELRQHDHNLGYGGNQKSCYQAALARGADVIVMLHPDYQYDPRLLVAISAPICYGVYDVMLGSRILGGGAIAGGMPPLKYVVNRALTFVQNILFRRKLSEYHTGYRAYHRRVLQTVRFEENSNDFVFDAQILAQVIAAGFRVGEVSCPTRYFAEASSIGLRSGVRYAWGCLWVGLQYVLQLHGLARFRYLDSSPDGAHPATND
jgi:glycosyltransferase involved in cell wall biosynthesis